MGAAVITGNHPYADAWPMLSEDDLAELAADIKANGLREPVVLYGDKILDGRNRYAACRAAGIEPVPAKPFDGDDDDALAFVQSVNNGRRHQTKGSLAASWALSMLAAGKRADGRWAYGAAKGNDRNNLNRKDQAQLGVIADHAPDLLVSVRDDDLSLNAAHEKACDARDAEQQRQERDAAAAKAEVEAKEFIEKKAPDLAARVDGEDLFTYSEARDLWTRRNQEAAEGIRRQKSEEQRKERERLDGIKRDVNRVLNFLDGLAAVANLHRHPYRDEVLAALPSHNRTRILRIEKEASWPTTL